MGVGVCVCVCVCEREGERERGGGGGRQTDRQTDRQTVRKPIRFSPKLAFSRSNGLSQSKTEHVLRDVMRSSLVTTLLLVVRKPENIARGTRKTRTIYFAYFS